MADERPIEVVKWGQTLEFETPDWLLPLITEMEAHDRRAREELAYTLLTDGSRPVDTYLWHEATAQITEAPQPSLSQSQQILVALSTALSPFYDAPRSLVSDDDLLAGLGAFVLETWRCLIADHPLLQASLEIWANTVVEQIILKSSHNGDGAARS